MKNRMETEHYFSKSPTSKKKPRVVNLFINGRNLSFKTSSGMFSPKRVDRATLIFIENMRLGDKILDLGSGYGPIGIAAAFLKPGCSVTMVEINERAVGLARENASLNQIKNARVTESDFFGNVDGMFDTILMNPPIAIGLKRLFELIGECWEHLDKGGSLQIVARHNKGGARIGARMEEVFGNMETLVKSGGFRVYMSVRSK